MSGLSTRRTITAVIVAVILNSVVVAALCIPQFAKQPAPVPEEIVFVRLLKPTPPPPSFPDPTTQPQISEPPPPAATKPTIPGAPISLRPRTAPQSVEQPPPPTFRKFKLAPPAPAFIAPIKFTPPPVRIAATPNHPSPPPEPTTPPAKATPTEIPDASDNEPTTFPAGLYGGRSAVGRASAVSKFSTPTPTSVDLGNAIPTPTHRVSPKYPTSALRLGLNGYVDVQFVIATDGSVTDVTIADSSSSRFHSATLTAIKQWRFEPVVRQGNPVTAHCVKRFSFQQR